MLKLNGFVVYFAYKKQSNIQIFIKTYMVIEKCLRYKWTFVL